MIFDRPLRDAEPLADLAVRKVFEVAQFEYLAAFGRQRLDRRVETRAQVVGIELTDDRTVVGRIVGAAHRGDPLLIVGAVIAGAPVLVQIVERAVVNRTQQIFIQGVRIVQRRAVLPHVVKDVLHHVLGPVVLHEKAGAGDQHGIVPAAKFVESLAVAVADPCRKQNFLHRTI